MVSIIENKMKELKAICKEFHVRRLDLFGSAATGQMDEASDLDFLVEFDDSVCENRFDNFFALQESLRQLFDRPVDLVEPGGLRNPYFIRRVNETRKAVYAAT